MPPAIPELDLHGFRFEDACAAVTQFVDHALFTGAEVVRIIHGHGVIANALAGWLAPYAHLTRIEREWANAGSTLVWISNV